MGKRILQWHPAFQAALQIELSNEECILQFEREYNLSDKPLQIDTLIIKKEPGRQIRKSIGRIFRQYNIVEYKGPEDYISINSFFKVNGYTCIYQADTEHEMEIPPEELTITLVGYHYPRKLLMFLRESYHAEVDRPYPGIYYISGFLFPIQILVIGELSKEENVWLGRLRNDLQLKEDIEPLAKAYRGMEKNPLYVAAMDLIVRANWKKYQEGRKMCEALRELFADELKERENMGIEQGKADSVLELLGELGPVPEQLRVRITSQSDGSVLSAWLKLAARANSIEEFVERITQ
ncbi:3-isopropylmalate dehydrogenase [Diplocloster hominis]|uniref:3-isopropylmalate dehydrogenase n=1 Tax=Diplocloster hominis TaxID=3079010 RepID=UPI0031BA2EF7